MKLLGPVMLLLLAATAAEAQTIEGFWQDSERRILFDRRAPASYQYGAWTPLDQQQTYPSAKKIRNSGGRFELVDLLYDDEHAIKVVGADDRAITFIRSAKFPACAMRHSCRLDGEQLFCALENLCLENGREVLDWRGEERYVRRASCERDGRRQAQGIPVRCR